MALKTVYRGYICFGYRDPALPGNPALRPTLIREYVFGDFVSEELAIQEFDKYFDSFVRENPNQQIPQFRLTEYKVTADTNIDEYFYNSDTNANAGVTPIQEINPIRS